MQKLVTIFLNSSGYSTDQWFKATKGEKHGFVEEHLKEYLADGWAVTALHGFGGKGDIGSQGWLAVLLEKK